ncbi:hypothetical protein [Actinomarinicola tropica]|uniref:Uncharacterized protein n=1 Tax=Actinomarinicola tropica TaxID=2789776 RepID=A0A5Q2RKL8_9ACTN|nr:hypothetical protein [Actinomarinicola tropica]QGG95462.1 hypothetical protein GH723_10330 [Actinomarinicola tropica]
MTTTTRASLIPRPRELLAGPTADLLCTLTLVVVVLNTDEDPAVFLLAVGGLVVGLLRPAWARHPAWWLAVGAVLALRQITAWEGVDNHVVVTTYWCLALGVCLLASDPTRAIGRSARLLIGLVFGFAVAWKIMSPDFLNGDFFRYTLLADERFEFVTRHLGGVSTTAYERNQAELASLHAAAPDARTAQLDLGPRVSTMAVAMTWFAVVTESAIAATHLAPLPPARTWWRPATLLFFCAGTYLVVPVGGFGCLLVTMALADSTLARRWRAALLWLFAGLVLYGPLWRVAFG